MEQNSHSASERETRPGGLLETIVVTASRRELPRSSVAGAVTVIDESDVRRTSPQVIAAILRDTPGIFFQQTTPGQGIPIVRGLKGSQVLHLIDGIRINNALFRNAPNQYLGLIDPALIHRVEVLRGAAGSLYGADAMGGVVQLLTTTPRFQGSEVRQSGRAYASFDSADRGAFLHAEGALGNQHGSLSGGISWQDRKNRRIGSGERIDPSGFESRAADLQVVINSGDFSEWVFSGQALEQPSSPRVDELVAGFGQTTPAASQYRYEPNSRSMLHARYRHRNPEAWLDTLEISLARQVIDDDRIIQAFESPVVSTEQNQSQLDGLTLLGVRQLNNSLTLTGGLEWYRDTIQSARQSAPVSSEDSIPVTPRFPDDSTMNSVAGYLNLAWTGNRWGIDSGLRYSYFEIRLPGTASTPSTQLNPDDVTGDLRLRFQLTPTIALLSNLGRGFRPPNIFDFSAFGPRPGNRFNIPNPELDSENVWSLDLGLRVSYDRWQMEAFAFVLDYRDRITSVPTGAVTPEGRIVVRSENRDEVHIRGFELLASWAPTDRLMVEGSLNITWGEEEDNIGSTTPADRIPPPNGRLGLNWQAADQWQVIPFIRFAGHQDRLSNRDRLDPRIDPNGTPGWVTANLHVQWQTTSALTLGLRIENIFNKNYREHGSGINAIGFNAGLWADLSF